MATPLTVRPAASSDSCASIIAPDSSASISASAASDKTAIWFCLITTLPSDRCKGPIFLIAASPSKLPLSPVATEEVEEFEEVSAVEEAEGAGEVEETKEICEVEDEEIEVEVEVEVEDEEVGVEEVEVEVVEVEVEVEADEVEDLSIDLCQRLSHDGSLPSNSIAN